VSLTDRLASLALVVADLNMRLSAAQQETAKQKQRADEAEAKLVEVERERDALKGEQIEPRA
jgi:hypothetical protein